MIFKVPGYNDLIVTKHHFRYLLVSWVFRLILIFDKRTHSAYSGVHFRLYPSPDLPRPPKLSKAELNVWYALLQKLVKVRDAGTTLQT